MIYTEIFDSLQSFSKIINSRTLNKIFQDKEIASQREDSTYTSFCGTTSYQVAEDKLRKGDREALGKLIKADTRNIKSGKQSTKMNIEKNVCGCIPNVPNYLLGIPNNMLNFKRIQYKTKILDIVVNIGASSNVSANKIINSSAKIASIIRDIESKGIRVNLYVACVTTDVRREEDSIFVAIKVKKSSSPLNMLNISYPLINPSMLRRHFFKFRETLPVKMSKSYVETYGVTSTIEKAFEKDEQLRKKFKDAICLDLMKVLDLSDKDISEMIAKSQK